MARALESVAEGEGSSDGSGSSSPLVRSSAEQVEAALAVLRSQPTSQAQVPTASSAVGAGEGAGVGTTAAAEAPEEEPPPAWPPAAVVAAAAAGPLWPHRAEEAVKWAVYSLAASCKAGLTRVQALCPQPFHAPGTEALYQKQRAQRVLRAHLLGMAMRLAQTLAGVMFVICQGSALVQVGMQEGK